MVGLFARWQRRAFYDGLKNEKSGKRNHTHAYADGIMGVLAEGRSTTSFGTI